MKYDKRKPFYSFKLYVKLPVNFYLLLPTYIVLEERVRESGLLHTNRMDSFISV